MFPGETLADNWGFNKTERDGLKDREVPTPLLGVCEPAVLLPRSDLHHHPLSWAWLLTILPTSSLARLWSVFRVILRKHKSDPVSPLLRISQCVPPH